MPAAMGLSFRVRPILDQLTNLRQLTEFGRMARKASGPCLRRISAKGLCPKYSVSTPQLVEGQDRNT